MYGVEGKEAAAKLNCWMPCGVSSLSDSSSSLMPLFEGSLCGLLRMRLKCCWTKFTSERAIFRAARFSRTICARLERLSRAKSCRRVKDLVSRLVQELGWRRVEDLVSRGKLNGREDDEDLLCRREEVLASEATFKWRLDGLVIREEFDGGWRISFHEVNWMVGKTMKICFVGGERLLLLKQDLNDG